MFEFLRRLVGHTGSVPAKADANISTPTVLLVQPTTPISESSPDPREDPAELAACEDAEVSSRAAELLERIATKDCNAVHAGESLPTLQQVMARNRRAYVAVEALKIMSRKAVPELIKALDRPFSDPMEGKFFRRRVLRLLVGQADDTCVPAINAAVTTDPDLNHLASTVLHSVAGTAKEHTDAIIAADSIHDAVKQFNAAAVRGILTAKPALICACREGDQPLHTAVKESDGEVEMVSLLVSMGADVRARNSKGYTPLHLNSLFGSKEIGEMLIAKGADVDAANPNDGAAPLHLAVRQKGKVDIVEWLLSKGAQIDLRETQYGMSALHVAAASDRWESIELLVSRGADKFARDKDGLSPLELARDMGRIGAYGQLMSLQ